MIIHRWIRTARCTFVASPTLLFTHSLNSSTWSPQPQTVVDRKHFNTLKRYRKILQDLLQTGISSESSSMLQIVNIEPGCRPGHYDVKCVLPIHQGSDIASQNSGSNAQLTALAASLERKVSINPVVESESQCPSANEEMEDVFSVLDVCHKPTNVYGLPRDEFIEKIHSSTRRERSKKNTLESTEPQSLTGDLHRSRDWARVWKQRQDWRAEARRDRRRVSQNSRLYAFQMDENGSISIHEDGKEDS